ETLCLDRRRCFHNLLDTLDARGLALASAEVIELGAAHAALADQFNLADCRAIHRENALYTDAEADAAQCECCRSQLARTADDHAFKWLYAFLFFLAALFRFGDFFQLYVHAQRVPGAKRRDVFAQLSFLDLFNNTAHWSIPGQTHSGGASAYRRN